jgi:putative transcriptional regulator
MIMIKIYLSKILGERRITQKELCMKTGIRPGTVSAYYHEFIKRMNVDDLNKMCSVLGCRLDELIEYIPDKNQI